MSKNPFDFETPSDQNQDNIYELTVSVSDGALQSFLDLEVRVLDDQDDHVTEPGDGVIRMIPLLTAIQFFN